MATPTLRCWANNGSGELGDGTTDVRTAPVTVTGITTATQVVAVGMPYGDYSCALLADRTVSCWGVNSFAQIDSDRRSDPVTRVPDHGEVGGGYGPPCDRRASRGGTGWCGKR